MHQTPPHSELELQIRVLAEENAALKDLRARIRHNLESLRTDNKRYQQLLENLNEVLYTLDEKTRVTYISSNVEKLSGYQPQKIMGRPFTDFVHPDELASRMDAFRRTLAGENLAPEYRCLTKNRGPVWVRTNARPMVTDGRLTGIQGMLVDITEHVEAEIENNRLQEQLHHKQKLELIGRLAGGIAHDLNNLLSPIIGYSEMLLHESGTEPVQKQQISHIMGAASRATAMVRQLLAFSRKQLLELKFINLNELLMNFRKLLEPAIREDITIRMRLADALPLIKADPGQLEQVIMNLAINAKDAMPQGGELILQTARVDLDEHYAGQAGAAKPGNRSETILVAEMVHKLLRH